MVGQAIEIDQGQRIQSDVRLGGHRFALRSPNDRPGQVKASRSAAATRKNEALEGLQPTVHFVYFPFEPVDLALNDAERHLARRKIIARGRKIGAEVEQLVLDPRQPASSLFVVDLKESNPDRAIGLVDIADRSGPWMSL